MTYDDPDCPIRMEIQIMEDYMEKIREEALEKISPLELAAIYQDFNEFCVRWREEEDIKRAEAQYE